MPRRKKENKQLATKGYVKNKVQSITRPMRRFYEHSPGTATVTNTATITAVFQPTQGDGYNNRDGNTCLINSMHLNGYAYSNASGSQDYVRVVLFQWRDDITPTESALIQNTGGVKWLSTMGFNALKSGRVKVLADRKVVLDVNNFPIKKFSIKKRYKRPLKVQFEGTGTTSGAGFIYMYLISTVSTNAPTLAHNLSFEFTSS